ncbi:MAG: tetratricopeptide repeat protein [Alphaproteobacteria bacterium]
MKRSLIGLCLLLSFAAAGPTLAAPLDDANAAYQRGDYATAEKILLPIAEAGNPYAQYRLGMIYTEAMGEMRSTAEAAKWFESAALQGQPFAQYKLGILYVKGDGVPKDFVLAYMWFSISAGHTLSEASEAARQRDMLAARMTSTQVAEAKKLVRSFRPVRFEGEAAPPR